MGVIKNLFHVSIQAQRYEEALAFYTEKLGFEQMFELNVGQFKKMLRLGEPADNDGSPWLTYLRIAPEQYLEMFNGAIEPPAFQKESIPVHEDSPFRYFALGCEDLEKTCAELKKRGVAVEEGRLQDPNGCSIRLVEKRTGKAGAHLFHSLAGVSLWVNSLQEMSAFLEKLSCTELYRGEGNACFSVGESGQVLELVQSERRVSTRPDDILGHVAFQIRSVTDTVKEWGGNGVYCCPQPFQPEVRVPADDTAQGNIGLDGCEIIWMICPEGNKIEVMVQPGQTMQQAWERSHPW